MSKSDSDWGWLIGNQVLEVSSGDVGVHELEETIRIGLLGKSDSDWGWLVSDEVLEVASGDVGIHKLEEAIGVRLLSESNGNWGWLVGDEVLEVASGDIGVHKFEEAISIRLLGIELNQGSGNWDSGIGDEVLEGLSGNVLSIELSNNGLGGHSAELSGSSLLGDINISIIVWESLIEHLLEGLSTLEGVNSNSSSWLSWLSHDEHRDGNVVVFVDILGLGSRSLSDGIEGIVSNNLSE